MLLIMLILSLPLVRLLVLSSHLIWYSCSFFCICHFSYLYISYLYFPYPYMSCFPFVNFPAIHDTLTVVCLLLSKFNSSQTLEFDYSWKLMTTRILLVLSGTIPDEKPFTSFLSFFCFSIAPGDSNTSILISLTNLSLVSLF